jgi:hypothetical protein
MQNKEDTVEWLKIELEEGIYFSAKVKNLDGFEGLAYEVLFTKTIYDYCDEFKIYLEEKKFSLGLTSEEIVSLISEVSLKIFSKLGLDFSSETEIDDASSESITSFSSGNNAEEIISSSNEWLNDPKDDIFMNQWFYKFCYSEDTYDIFLIYKKNPKIPKTFCEMDWFEKVNSVTYLQFKNFLFMNSVEVEEIIIGSVPCLNYNNVIFEFSTHQHFFEDNSFFEFMRLDQTTIDSLLNVEYPIVKAFIVFVKDNVANSLFNILYEPILSRYTLNKIYKSNVSKVIEVGGSIEELEDVLVEHYFDDANNPIFY